MVAGRKIIKVEAGNKETEEKVLLCEAEVEQPVSSYVFTGQGSQEQGMGMDLYSSSTVAQEVWDRADKHFVDNYGKLGMVVLSILANVYQGSLLSILSRTIQKNSQSTLVVLVERPFAKTTCP